MVGLARGPERIPLAMAQPKYLLRATHVKSREQLTLSLHNDATWFVGRDDGTVRPDKWSISFDPALSRDHFRMKFGSGRLLVEATKNRHPILFRGQPEVNFVLGVGQSFSTARLLFELESVDSTLEATFAEPPPDQSDSMTLKKEFDLLTITGMASILINGGAGFGKVFGLLNRHQSGWLQPVLQDLEKGVLHKGEPLSKALARHPRVFSEVYVTMVEIGESGDLGRALNRLYRQLAQILQRRGIPLCEHPEALATACRTIAEILDQGGSESKALSFAAKASSNEKVRLAFGELERQVLSGNTLTECHFPPLFPPIVGGFIAAHQAVGNLPKAFKDLAELLEPAT